MNPPETISPRATREETLSAPEPLQILCVEDHDGDFELVREYLKRAPFQTAIQLHRATSIAEARQLFGNGGARPPYSIVLLDLSLHDAHGAETYYRLLALAPQTAVVILSGNDDQKLALRLVQSGAQDYVPKDTLTPDLLMRCITYAMKRQQSRVEMENLTERLRRISEELKTAQMQLIQAEKLESLGRLATSVAHEVKNPLGVIQMGIDFLNSSLAQVDGDVGRTLRLMQEAVTRADCTIHDMLDFSNSQGGRMEACPLNELAGCVERMLKYECNRHNITFRLELTTPSPAARCDRIAVEQVLINIVTNSLQAMSKGGTVTLRTKRGRAADLPRDEGLREMNVLRAGDEVSVIEVQDEGPGIRPEILSRIFDPFFTTKPTGEGTGLGLSICKRVIDLHRGQLLVSNVEEPRGLLVSIALRTAYLNSHPPEPNRSREPDPRPAPNQTTIHYEGETNPRH
jgi:signal transduction histidine kinase